VKVNNSVAVSKTVAPVAIAKPSSSSRGKKGVPTSAININVATLDQLEQLPGVGPIMAQKIIDFRVKYGKFKKITDVQNVAGMGAAHYAKISKYIKVS
jgi:competence protein ComEA